MITNAEGRVPQTSTRYSLMHNASPKSRPKEKEMLYYVTVQNGQAKESIYVGKSYEKAGELKQMIVNVTR